MTELNKTSKSMSEDIKEFEPQKAKLDADLESKVSFCGGGGGGGGGSDSGGIGIGGLGGFGDCDW